MKEDKNIYKIEHIQMEVNFLAMSIELFCRNSHSDVKSRVQAKGRAGEFLEDVSIELCYDCDKLLLHAVSKRIICPYDPKPMCKKCHTHCYGKVYRERIKEVMRFSGDHFFKGDRKEEVER